MLAPLDHPDPAHCLVTGTGLTHLGSAQARDAMHQAMQQAEEQLSDSMKMFRLGLEGGRPEGDGPGVAPEWFYKGDGSIVAAPGQPLTMPGFALDGGEEAEIAMLYVIDDDGRPWRVGYALGNEFADHVLERQNYLYLAHSKLRPCAFGPELLLGELPPDVRGRISVVRGGERIWQAEFISGEANMSHTLANLEHHHFKYPLFRRPGDVHVHFIGAAVLSFTAGIKAEPGDVFEIDVPRLRRAAAQPARACARRRHGAGEATVARREFRPPARPWPARRAANPSSRLAQNGCAEQTRDAPEQSREREQRHSGDGPLPQDALGALQRGAQGNAGTGQRGAEHHDIALGHARQMVPEAPQADGEHPAEQHRPERCPEG